MRSKGSKYHPARISGEQKRIRERIANDVTTKDPSIKPQDVIEFKKSKRRKST